MAAYVPNKNDPDYIKGLDSLKRFYTASRSLFPSNVTYSFEEFVATLSSRKGQVAFVESFGFAINQVEFSNSKVQSAMYSLAQRAQGKIPSKNGDFFLYLQNEGAKIDYVDMAKFVAIESGATVIGGLEKIGNTAIATGQVISWIMPFVPFIALFILYKIVTDKKVMGNLSSLAKLK